MGPKPDKSSEGGRDRFAKFWQRSTPSPTITLEPGSDLLYTGGCRPLPIGLEGHLDYFRSIETACILNTNFDEYVCSLLTYFLNDEQSVMQCWRLSKLASSGSGLVPISSSACIHPESGQGNFATGHCSIHTPTSALTRSDSGEILPHFGYNSSSENVTPKTCVRESHAFGTSDDNITNSHSSSSSHASQSSNTADCHYLKINTFVTFYIDLVNLLGSNPALGSELLAAPLVFMHALDAVIVPRLYSIVESVVVKTGAAHFDEIFEHCKAHVVVAEDEDHVQLREILIEHLGNTTVPPQQDDKDPVVFTITTRLRNIPPTANIWRSSVNDINYSDLGRLIMLEATVSRVGALAVLEEEREYLCAKCNTPVLGKAVPELGYCIQPPIKCMHPDCVGGFCFSQGSYTKRTDVQEIKIQSIGSNACVAGSLSVTIPALLRRDIAGAVVPGDAVQILAVVKQRWKRIKRGQRVETEIFLDVNNISLLSANRRSLTSLNSSTRASLYRNFWLQHKDDLEFEGRRKIIDGMDTGLLGVDNAKLALLLVVIGGSGLDVDLQRPGSNSSSNSSSSNSKTFGNRWAKYSTQSFPKSSASLRTPPPPCNHGSSDSGSLPSRSSPATGGTVSMGPHSRTSCHLLLLGTPGTGKSKLLKYAKNLSDIHVYVCGTNCSSAGLTCVLIRDCNETMLAAGALVMADGGICCIDEFTRMPHEDKACLHEAMEQQNVSIAKAGIKCCLKCRCSIIAASNYKHSGQKDPFNTPEKSIILVEDPLALLSRFDLVVVLNECPLSDLELAQYILDETGPTIDDDYDKSAAVNPWKSATPNATVASNDNLAIKGVKVTLGSTQKKTTNCWPPPRDAFPGQLKAKRLPPGDDGRFPWPKSDTDNMPPPKAHEKKPSTSPGASFDAGRRFPSPKQTTNTAENVPAFGSAPASPNNAWTKGSGNKTSTKGDEWNIDGILADLEKNSNPWPNSAKSSREKPDKSSAEASPLQGKIGAENVEASTSPLSIAATSSAGASSSSRSSSVGSSSWKVKSPCDKTVSDKTASDKTSTFPQAQGGIASFGQGLNCGQEPRKSANSTLDWRVGNTLKEYIQYVKTCFFPTLTTGAKTIMQRYYMQLRLFATACKNGTGPTVRTLESLIRLSQAHARLMFRREVQVLDAVSVVWVYEFGLSGCLVGSCHAATESIERLGLVVNVKEIMTQYNNTHKTTHKFGNGILDAKMYRHFEAVLLQYLSLQKDANGNIIDANA